MAGVGAGDMAVVAAAATRLAVDTTKPGDPPYDRLENRPQEPRLVHHPVIEADRHEPGDLLAERQQIAFARGPGVL